MGTEVLAPHEPLRDRGLPQEVQVSTPAGFAVYDVLSHHRLDATLADGRQSFMVHLEPGCAAVLAALPRRAVRELRGTERTA